ncbi:MAG: T9SS type A sorting domain-containing protein [Bacteroidota bacterium]
MKRTLPLLCLLLPLLASAQTLPTQIQQFEWRQDLFDWVLREGISYQYDDRDSVRTEDRISNWFGASRTLWKTDEEGRFSMIVNFWLDEDDVWQATNRTTYTYHDDESSERLEESKQENGSWQTNFHTLITQNRTDEWVETNMLTQRLDPDNMQWTDNHKSVERLGHDGLLLLRQREDWRNGQWELSYYQRYEYDAQGNLTLEENSNHSISEPEQRRWQYVYNANFQTLEVKIDYRDRPSLAWQPLQKTVYEFDDQSRETLEERTLYLSSYRYKTETAYRGDTIIKAQYQGTTSEPYQGRWRRSYIPHPKGNLPYLYYHNERWENGKWQTSTAIRRSLQFNEQDDLLRVDEEGLVAGQWIAISHTNYTWQYREDGLPLSQSLVQYDYRNERQIPLTKTVWTYEDRSQRSAKPIVELYPNPSAGPLNVSFHSAPALPVSWQLLDQRGAVVRQSELDEVQQQIGLSLEVNDLQTGLYILQIQYEDGSTVAKKWQRN